MAEQQYSNEQAFFQLLQMFPAPVAMHNTERFTFVNRSLLKAVGADSPGQVIGNQVLDFVHPEDVQRTIDSLSLPYYEDFFTVKDLHCLDLNKKDFFRRFCRHICKY